MRVNANSSSVADAGQRREEEQIRLLDTLVDEEQNQAFGHHD